VIVFEEILIPVSSGISGSDVFISFPGTGAAVSLVSSPRVGSNWSVIRASNWNIRSIRGFGIVVKHMMYNYSVLNYNETSAERHLEGIQ